MATPSSGHASPPSAVASVRPAGRAAAPREAVPSCGGIAGDLQELATGDAAGHQNFWLELARELTAHGPATSDWFQQTVARCSDSTNDALGRYFDATPSGLEYIYRKKLKDGAPGMDRQRLCDALVDHFGFSGKTVTLETMRGVLDKAEGPDGLISMDSFAEVVRKLRIGALLLRNFVLEQLDTTAVHLSVHCDEYWSVKAMNFDGGEGQGDSGLLSCQLRGDMARINVALEEDDEDKHAESFTKFLFHSPRGQATGEVQWLHVHQPDTRLALALGQRFHLRLSVLGILCRINEVPPQIDHSGKNASLGTSSWSSVVFPCAFLDTRSRRSLTRYKEWRGRREQLARQNSPLQNTSRSRAVSGLRPRDPEKAAAADDEPSIFVGVIRVSQVLLWNDTTVEGEDIVTSLGTPKYLGYWLAALPETWAEGGLWSNLASLLPCTRRSRLGKEARQHGGGYTRLSQNDGDQTDEEMGDPANDSRANSKSFTWSQKLTRESVDVMLNQSADEAGLMGYQGEAEQETDYCSFYRGILQQLQDKNSVLRMGNAFHLLVRIILDGTTEYTCVLELYEIAIAKCKTKLAKHNSRDGPDLITMISLAKMELKTILGSLQGFESAVLPTLRKLCTSPGGSDHKISLSERIVRHHMVDIDHNIAQVVRESQCQIHICESLIDEYDRNAMDKANNILNFLTFITFLMVPLQILTGYYGMNFTHGLYGVKEKEGEMYFWTFGLVGTLVMACIMLYLNRTY